MNLWVVGLWVIFFILAHLFVGTLLGLLYVFNDPVLELVCLLASDVLNVGTCMCVYEHCSTEGGIFTYQNTCTYLYQKIDCPYPTAPLANIILFCERVQEQNQQ